MLLCASSKCHCRKDTWPPRPKEAAGCNAGCVRCQRECDSGVGVVRPPEYQGVASLGGMRLAVQASYESNSEEDLALDRNWLGRPGRDCGPRPGVHGLEPAQTSPRACCECESRAHGDHRWR